jgi:hypothetical protein
MSPLLIFHITAAVIGMLGGVAAMSLRVGAATTPRSGPRVTPRCFRPKFLVIDDQNSTVAVRWSARGANVERFLEIGPTNRATEMTGIEIIQIVGGQVTRRWGEWGISAHHE